MCRPSQCVVAVVVVAVVVVAFVVVAVVVVVCYVLGVPHYVIMSFCIRQQFPWYKPHY